MDLPRRPYYVYIVASLSRTTYVRMTNDLARRMHEHRTRARDGFATRYNVDRLMWYEVTGNVSAAIVREKQIKAYSRKKKVALIEAANAGWNDLAVELGLVVPAETAGGTEQGHDGISAATAPGPRGGGE